MKKISACICLAAVLILSFVGSATVHAASGNSFGSSISSSSGRVYYKITSDGQKVPITEDEFNSISGPAPSFFSDFFSKYFGGSGITAPGNGTEKQPETSAPEMTKPVVPEPTKEAVPETTRPAASEPATAAVPETGTSETEKQEETVPEETRSAVSETATQPAESADDAPASEESAVPEEEAAAAEETAAESDKETAAPETAVSESEKKPGIAASPFKSEAKLNRNLDQLNGGMITGKQAEISTSSGAVSGIIRHNASNSTVTCNASNGSLSAAITSAYAGDTIYFNFQVSSDLYVKNALLYVKSPEGGSYNPAATKTARNYMRYETVAYTVPSETGRLNYYWRLTMTNGAVHYTPVQSLTVRANTLKGCHDLADGWYMIVSGANDERVLDINGWNSGNGGNLECYYRNNTTNQRFYLHYENGYYTIKALHSGKYIHVADENKAASNVHQWSGSESRNAKWALINAGNGYYYLQNAGNGSMLDLNNGSSRPGENVQTYYRNNSSAQRWRFVSTSDKTSNSRPVADGWYMIESACSSDRVLDLNNWNQNNGGNVEIYQKNGTTNQWVRVTYVGEGYYNLMFQHSGKYIHAAGTNSTPDNVHQWEGGNHNNALWYIESDGRGYFYLRNKNGNYLDNTNCRTTLGNNVITYYFNGCDAQRWRFVGQNKQKDVNIVPTVFSQNDSRWVNYHYGYASDEDEKNGDHATIGLGGCGILSIVNAVYYLNGKFIQPQTLGDWAINWGYRPNGGTKDGLAERLAAEKGGTYGIEFVGYAGKITDIKDNLMNGDVAVVHVQKHFIAVVNYNPANGTYLVLDSLTSSNRLGYGVASKWITAGQFKGRLAMTDLTDKPIQLIRAR